MALEPATREIDGHRYTYRPLGAKAGMRLFTALVQRLGGSVGAAMGGGVDRSALGANAIGELCRQLDPDFVEHLIDQLAPRTTVALPGDSGTKDVDLSKVLDLHFGGRLLAQLHWLEFCLETQYADFLGELKTKLGGDRPAGATEGGE